MPTDGRIGSELLRRHHAVHTALDGEHRAHFSVMIRRWSVSTSGAGMAGLSWQRAANARMTKGVTSYER